MKLPRLYRVSGRSPHAKLCCARYCYSSSVCLSVCLSVWNTVRYCARTAKRIVRRHSIAAWYNVIRVFLFDSESVTRTSAGSRNMAKMLMHKEKLAISPQRVIRSTSCSVSWSGFLGRWIEWIYFGLNQIQNQIQETAARHFQKFRINISGMDCPMTFM